MKVKKIETVDFKILLGDPKTKFKGLQKDILAKWKKFLKSDRDTWMLDELNSGYFFVKKKANDEGHRQVGAKAYEVLKDTCLLYTSPSPRDQRGSRMPSSA